VVLVIKIPVRVPAEQVLPRQELELQAVAREARVHLRRTRGWEDQSQAAISLLIQATAPEAEEVPVQDLQRGTPAMVGRRKQRAHTAAAVVERQRPLPQLAWAVLVVLVSSSFGIHRPQEGQVVVAVRRST
jgi:hypothetical protein